jgi:hypothetical protein
VLGAGPQQKLPRSADLPANVQFSLLGPVRAWRGPAELDLGPNQQRAVLTLLLVRANQLVTTHDLIELLWECYGSKTRQAVSGMPIYNSRLLSPISPHRQAAA